MNRHREQKGEGIEYFVMLLAILLVIIVRGSGSLSIDLFMIKKTIIKNQSYCCANKTQLLIHLVIVFLYLPHFTTNDDRLFIGHCIQQHNLWCGGSQFQGI